MKREAAVGVIETCDASRHRACRLVSVDPKTVRRDATSDNLQVHARMREIPAVCRRFGYRRIGLMLEREGLTMKHKKPRQLYKEECSAGPREPKPISDGPAKRWSLDLLADALGAARRFHMLDVIHHQTRECLALAATTSLSGARVARELDRCIQLYDKPQQNGFVESLATPSFGSTASCATNA